MAVTVDETIAPLTTSFATELAGLPCACVMLIFPK